MPDGNLAVAFIEVDLASMTQTLLKEKVARYLAYAADRAWEGIHPYCPPMLLLTTTATRAATFVRAAGQLIARHEERLPFEDPAEVLVVAACGLVRDPGRAVGEACWKVPEAAAAELTLAELLSERLDAQVQTEDNDAQRAIAQRRSDLEVLQELRSLGAMSDWLGSERAAEALKAIIGNDPAGFLDGEPDLAAQILDWGRHWRRIPLSDRRERAKPLIPILEARHTSLWAQQARLLLSSHDHLAAGEPRLCRLIATLADGHLATDAEIAMLRAAPARTRQQLQRDAWGDYPAQRKAAVEARWAALGRRVRRQTSLEQLAAEHNDDHLIICDTCHLVYLNMGPDTLLQRYCPHCDGTIVDWTDRGGIVPLTGRLDEIRERLDVADEVSTCRE
jgi:hypothetical protein